MIGEILPAEVSFAEAFSDALAAPLFPEEKAAIGGAVEKRRREFATVRRCGRAALAEFGYPPVPILPGHRGSPQWPAGMVGSMTHCAGYRAAAVARATDLVGIGIDAEPDETLPPGVLEFVSLAEERTWIGRLHASWPSTPWDRLLFCAKEALFKTWYPITSCELGFEEVLVTVDASSQRFTAELRRPRSMLGTTGPTHLTGRWLRRHGFVMTAVTLPTTQGGPGSN